MSYRRQVQIKNNNCGLKDSPTHIYGDVEVEKRSEWESIDTLDSVGFPTSGAGFIFKKNFLRPRPLLL